MIFDRRPVSHDLDGLRGGSKGQNSTFSQQGHVAYQIKENQKCCNYFARRPSLPLMGSVGQNYTLSEPGHVTYQINEHDKAATW